MEAKAGGGLNPSKVGISSPSADSRMSASRFMVQRLNSAEVGVPRRRSSVTHGHSEFNATTYIMSNEFPASDVSTLPAGFASSPALNARTERRATLKEGSNGLMLGVDNIRDHIGGSMRAHLRDSLRTPRTLQHHLSREALPKIDNYHAHLPSGTRPTIEELYLGETPVDKTGGHGNEVKSQGYQFGWIQGVLIRCLLNIWGVMLFLRLSWVVAQAGIGQAILVVLLASTVTSLTTLSMSAVSTNGQIKGGGTYYMISRSLGPEFGGAIGIIFALANAVAVSLHTVGFCEALNDLLVQQGIKIVDNGENDIRIIGSATLIVLACIVSIGMEWEAKAQLLLMGILVVSLGNFLVGSFMGPTSDDEIAKGFVGFDGQIAATNLLSDYRIFDGIQQNFFSVFAIFFPAATGILAGANISGDLKDPSHAIPKGTLLAVAITTVSYVIFATIAGASVLREATGNVTDYVNGTVTDYMDLCVNQTCQWGLHNSYQVMELISAFGALNYAGCFAATLSSALACFVSAPKVFQALCKDRLFPYLHVFAKGYGKNQEPLRGYALTFVIALGCILIAKLNVIAPLISNCYLASYALVNFSTFHIDLIQPVGWRPKFQYYNKWLSLLGCALSVTAMFLCSWPTALITFAVVFALFLVVKYRKPEVNWGSSAQAQAYKTALITVQQLNTTEDHVKTYTPQILVMTGSPNMRPTLVDFAYLLCKKNSLMICGHIMKERQNHRQRSAQTQKATRWLRVHKTKAFYNLVDNMNFSDGVAAMLQASGIGKMRPNILLLGYKGDWRSSSKQDTEDYFASIHTALELHMAVAVLRVQEGFDYTGIIADFDWTNPSGLGVDNKSFAKTNDDTTADQLTFNSNASLKTIATAVTLETMESGRSKETLSVTASDTSTVYGPQPKAKKTKILFKDPHGNELSREVQQSICRFRLKQKRGTIDVWWLYDDGGLSMLLPHILTTRSTWANSKLRVFALIDEKEDFQTGKKNMMQLLAKFRIPVSDVVLISDITLPPQTSTKTWFDNLTKNYVRHDNHGEAEGENPAHLIKESELMAMKSKTFRHMRLRELLLQHSITSNLIVMTLPMPRKGTVSAPLYMAWLETLTANMPPFLLVRGNQTSVLTFYS